MISMQTLDDLDRSTIVDSLRDAEEANDNGFYSTGADVFRDMRDAYAILSDKVEAGMEITEEQRGMIIDALDISIENCVDLGLVADADDYVSAKILVADLRHA